jgi:ubiquinol-cytochrome c reductase cytochrome c subunit
VRSTREDTRATPDPARPRARAAPGRWSFVGLAACVVLAAAAASRAGVASAAAPRTNQTNVADRADRTDVGGSSRGDPDPTDPARAPGGTTPAGATPVDARHIYLADCATCHGAHGEGTAVAPSIAHAGAADVDLMLSTGRMPVPAGASPTDRRPPLYDDRTRAALVAYVGTLGTLGTGGVPGPAIPTLDLAHADLARGGDLFRAQCAACHTAAGAGGALLDQRAPSLGASTPEQVAEATRAGPGTMPVFPPAAISDQELSDVAAYVSYLHEPDDRGGFSFGHLGPLPEGAVALLGLGFLVVVCVLIERRVRTRAEPST